VDRRAAWIEAGRQAVAGGTVDSVCPENGDAALLIEWIPAILNDAAEGEYRLWCPICGAQNFVLVKHRKAP
jgi:hypothetical protein